MLNTNYWVEHWFNPSPTGGGTGTQCRDCWGWRDDPRHRYGEQPNLAAYVVEAQPGVGELTIRGRRRGAPKSSGKRAVQPVRLGRRALAKDLSARGRARARQILAEYAETVAFPLSQETQQSEEQAAGTPRESALVF